MPLQETLERGGHAVTWDGESASGPNGKTPDADLIVLDAESEGCIEASKAWRDHDPPPGVLMVSQSPASQARAKEARCVFVPTNGADAVFEKQVQSVMKFRFAGRMSGSYARAVLKLGPASEPLNDAGFIIKGSRKVDLDLVRECLRWHATEYVSVDNEMIKALREQRVLIIPEVEAIKLLDGTRTVQTLVAPSSDAGVMRGRLLWGLLSSGTARCTVGPPDEQTPARKLIAETRRHLLARRERLARGTYYDVLEVSPQSNPQRVDYAARTLALRFSPDRLNKLDLAECAPLVAPLWKQILQAREILMAPNHKSVYDGNIVAKRNELKSPWAFDIQNAGAAEDFFRKGQAALVAGEAFKAVSSMAGACRSHPEHPDYEVSLCWARFRAEIERGGDRERLIGKERTTAESHLVGRRPWPRALVALALLCAADGDSDSARFHLKEALAVDPNLPAAKQLLGRL
jgi:hypothetical protein